MKKKTKTKQNKTKQHKTTKNKKTINTNQTKTKQQIITYHKTAQKTWTETIINNKINIAYYIDLNCPNKELICL